MLQSIHDNAKGWVAYLIVILISVPFALWGIQSYLGGSGKSIVAVVNGEEIEIQEVQNAVSQQRQRMQQMFGKLPPGFDEASLKQSALQGIIDQKLLEQYAKEKGYRASPGEVVDLIRSIPQFQRDGKFDPQLYHQVLASQGRVPAGFEQQLRSSITVDQFRNAIADTAFMPKTEMQQYQTLSQQKRDIEIYTLKADEIVKDLEISDKEIEAYYKEHPDKYQTEEMVKVAYVEVNAADIAKSVEVTDELLQAYYDENADIYFEKATFKMSHIKVGISDKQSEEQAKAKADAIYASIVSGEKTFEAIAEREDDESLFSELGDAVGFLSKGSIDSALEDAVFAAKPGEVIKPILTPSGYEIIKVIEVVNEHQKPFDQAKAEVEKDYRKSQATERYEDQLEVLRTTSFENDGSLDPAAKAISSEIKHSDFFSRRGGKGIASYPPVVEAAFRDDVLLQGVNSSLIEISDSHALVLRLDEHKKPQQKPLSEVRDAIVQQLKKEKGKKLAKEKGDVLLADIKLAGNWSSLGDQASAVVKYADVSRNDPKVMPFITSEVFKLPAPVAGKTVYTAVENPNGDYSIIALTAVKKGEDTLDEATISQYSSYIGNRIQAATLKAMHDQADIEIFPERLNRENN